MFFSSQQNQQGFSIGSITVMPLEPTPGSSSNNIISNSALSPNSSGMTSSNAHKMLSNLPMCTISPSNRNEIQTFNSQAPAPFNIQQNHIVFNNMFPLTPPSGDMRTFLAPNLNFNGPVNVSTAITPNFSLMYQPTPDPTPPPPIASPSCSYSVEKEQNFRMNYTGSSHDSGIGKK